MNEKINFDKLQQEESGLVTDEMPEDNQLHDRFNGNSVDADAIVDEFAHEVVENKEIFDIAKRALDNILPRLNDREKQIIKMRLGLDNDPHTLDEVGEKLKLHRERVRQIQNIAFDKIFRRIRNELETEFGSKSNRAAHSHFGYGDELKALRLMMEKFFDSDRI